MKCRDCANLCYSKGIRINFCYARFIPIGDEWKKDRRCDSFEEGTWSPIYEFDPPHIEDDEHADG